MVHGSGRAARCFAALAVIACGLVVAQPASADQPPKVDGPSSAGVGPPAAAQEAGAVPGRGRIDAPPTPGVGRGPLGEHPLGDDWPHGVDAAEDPGESPSPTPPPTFGGASPPAPSTDGDASPTSPPTGGFPVPTPPSAGGAPVPSSPSADAGVGSALVSLGAGRVDGRSDTARGAVFDAANPEPVPHVDVPAEARGLFGVDSPLAPFRQDPGAVAWWLVVAVAVAAVSGFGLRHVTSRHEIETARRFATRDPLTGLANRRLFEEALTREIARQRRKATPLALALIDLDGFKLVNDTRGHAGGDEVLCAVARAIVDRVRASDLPARIGGDEFAVVLPDCSPSDALRVGESLREQIEAAVGPTVTASVGVAVVPDHADDADALVAAADAALYAAKETGRNRAVMVDSEVPAVRSD